jgi:hypothetical protein
MSGGFVKVYEAIIRSSVWAESPETKLAWLTLLIIADANGRVEGTIPGIAQVIGISVEEFESALAIFLAPDRYSRTRDHDGRRLREIDGGWEIINHRLYRDKRSDKQVRQANWVAERRASTRVDMSTVSPPRGQRAEDIDLEISSNSPAAAPDAPAVLQQSGAGLSKAETAQAVKAVFDVWQKEHSKRRSKLDGKRNARIRARLGEGFTVEQLCDALRGAKKDPFLMGRDPRAGRAFDGLETLLRDAAQVERLIALEEGAADYPAPVAEEGQWLT